MTISFKGLYKIHRTIKSRNLCRDEVLFAIFYSFIFGFFGMD